MADEEQDRDLSGDLGAGAPGATAETLPEGLDAEEREVAEALLSIGAPVVEPVEETEQAAEAAADDVSFDGFAAEPRSGEETPRGASAVTFQEPAPAPDND